MDGSLSAPVLGETKRKKPPELGAMESRRNFESPELVFFGAQKPRRHRWVLLLLRRPSPATHGAVVSLRNRLMTISLSILYIYTYIYIYVFDALRVKSAVEPRKLVLVLSVFHSARRPLRPFGRGGLQCSLL